MRSVFRIVGRERTIGYERGAFTGAHQGKARWFEIANGGTLFLDEIGDLPLSMQVKLLRVLQEREVVRLGGRKALPINVRLIAATNVDLAKAVRAGRFREDLYYRLQVIVLPLRPLRERTGDVLPLARHFLKMYADRLHSAVPTVTLEAEQALSAYPWPGNIRELENVIHRALLVGQEGKVTTADLHLPEWRLQDDSSLPVPHSARMSSLPPVRARTHSFDGKDSTVLHALRVAWQAWLDSDHEIAFEDVQHQLIEDAWRSNQENQVCTARQLNLSRNTLRTFLKKAQLL